MTSDAKEEEVGALPGKSGEEEAAAAAAAAAATSTAAAAPADSDSVMPEESLQPSASGGAAADQDDKNGDANMLEDFPLKRSGSGGEDDDDGEEGPVPVDLVSEVNEEERAPPQDKQQQAAASGEDEGSSKMVAKSTSSESSVQDRDKEEDKEEEAPFKEAPFKEAPRVAPMPKDVTPSPPKGGGATLRKQTSMAEDEVETLHGEILFEPSMGRDGYSNDWWLKTSSTRNLVHSGPVTRLVEPKRGFGLGLVFAEQYVGRTLALFRHPDVIFVLRPARDEAEVKTLLNLPKDLEFVGKDGFFVAESVVDLNTCKMRLSQLTTPTSFASIAEDTSASPSASDLKRRTCFELSTPSEKILLSVVVPPDDNNNGTTRDDKQISSNGTKDAGYLETLHWETAIAMALHAAHAPVYAEMSVEVGGFETDMAWKHMIVRGSLHSIVVSGHTDVLKRALEIALAPEADDDDDGDDDKGREVKELSKEAKSRILDERDEFGLTAIMYACTRRSKDAVSLLVDAKCSCTVTTPRDLKTPSHLSAECLDEKSLSTILSATYPSRPDPNTLDAAGRTPMYLASVRGKTVEGGSDDMALGRCLSALEAWGGQMFVPDPEDRLPLIHPISFKALEWKAAEINVLFSHMDYFYPLKDDEATSEGKIGDSVLSIGQQMNYPLHSALIALRQKIAAVKADGLNHGFEYLGSDPPLFSTLQTLLKHGIDVNERLKHAAIRDKVGDELNAMFGFSPLQILAAAALDAQNLASEVDRAGESGSNSHTVSSATVEGIMHCIVESAVLLVSAGGRVSLAVPPAVQPTAQKKESKAAVKKLSKLSLGRGSSENTAGSSGELVSAMSSAVQSTAQKKESKAAVKKLSKLSLGRGSSENTAGSSGELVSAMPSDVLSNLPLVDRSAVKIDENEDIMKLMGGKEKLAEARSAWLAEPSVRDSKTMELHPNLQKEEVRGDSNFCAICWTTFGTVSNRRHMCRITKRYVCDDCSSKRMQVNGSEHRISDGQFLLAQVEGAKADEEEQIIYDQERQQHQEQKKKERAARLAGPSQSADEEDEVKAELFGGAIVKNMKTLFMGEEEEEEEDKLQSVTASLSATRDAFNERGERLNSLAEKTAALQDASKDFAAMAKELNKQQQSRGLFW